MHLSEVVLAAQLLAVESEAEAHSGPPSLLLGVGTFVFFVVLLLLTLSFNKSR